jgi:hypothetical protein
MVQVVTESKWLRWCAARQLPVATAHFALETCYYGLGLRSRPGTILVTDSELIHHSYSWRDTLWAMFEPSLSISCPLASVCEILRLRLSIGVRFLQAIPDSAFRVVMRDGHTHDFVLQRRGNEFVQALRSRGFTISDESHAA